LNPGDETKLSIGGEAGLEVGDKSIRATGDESGGTPRS
jgi:hypothetical protein